MIAIPVIGDQFRNAQLLKRTGAGSVSEKKNSLHMNCALIRDTF